eukprot:4269594-Prymnesium_polylepis.1
MPPTPSLPGASLSDWQCSPPQGASHAHAPRSHTPLKEQFRSDSQAVVSRASSTSSPNALDA